MIYNERLKAALLKQKTAAKRRVWRNSLDSVSYWRQNSKWKRKAMRTLDNRIL